MAPFQDLARTVTEKYNERIKKSCDKLFQCFNLNYMYYYEVTEDGYFGCFGSKPEWMEYFGDQKFYLTNPYHRHPKFFKEGVVLLKDIQNENFRQISRAGEEKFNFNTGLQFMHRIAGGLGAFGFTSNTSNEMQVSMLVNELPVFWRFIEKFREENQRVFSDLIDSRINLSRLMGPLYYEKALPEAPPSVKRHCIVEELGFPQGIKFSSREIDVMRLLLEGSSASQMGQSLSLSKRTIEHHVERIKDKLECGSKAELVQKARELERLGCLRGMPYVGL